MHIQIVPLVHARESHFLIVYNHVRLVLSFNDMISVSIIRISLFIPIVYGHLRIFVFSK